MIEQVPVRLGRGWAVAEVTRARKASMWERNSAQTGSEAVSRWL